MITKLDTGNNPEVKIINPDGLWIKREQIDEIKDKLSTKAIIGKNKVYIIFIVCVFTLPC